MTQQVPPAWPDAVGYLTNMRPTVALEVAIEPDGKIADAWVWGPSGYPDIDNAAINAALLTKYSSPMAYCQNVPGIYLFIVTYDPR